MVIAWELGIKMKQRTGELADLVEGDGSQGARRRRKWEAITGWDDDSIDEDDDEQPPLAGDILGEVSRTRKRANTALSSVHLDNGSEVPYEDRWEPDEDDVEDKVLASLSLESANF
jgi:WD repeat-containing protein 48